MKTDIFRRPLYIVIGFVVLFFLTVLIGTPFVIDLSLERWITAQGPEIAQVGNIDFNPFTGRMAMDNLVVETKSGRTVGITHASLQFSWKQLLKKHLYLKELALQDVFMLVDQLGDRGLRVGGLILQELAGSGEGPAEPGWYLGIERFILRNGQIAYKTPELTATVFIDSYSLQGLETWNKQKPVKMAYQGRIDESTVAVEAEVVPLADIKTWKGHVSLKKGSLELLSKARGLQEYAPSGMLDLDLQLDARMEGNGDISALGEGSLVLRNGRISYADAGLQEEQIAWQGKTEIIITGDEISLAMEADLDGIGIKVQDQKNELELLGLGTFDIAGLSVDSRQHDNNVSMAAVEIKNFSANIIRNKDGDWQFGALVPEYEDTVGEPTASGDSQTGGQKFGLQVGSLNIGGESSVSFADESLPRPFKTVFHIDEFTMAEIDTADAGKPASYNLKGRVGDYGTVAFEGTVVPTGKPVSLEATGKIGGLDLVPFTSYTGRTIGYNITSGQMDADISQAIDKGIMDGKFTLHFRNLEVAQVDPEKEPEVDKQMDVPLGSALAMLRDNNDEINLDLELQGDISSPEFGIQDAINQALAKALQFASLSYLKYALQPFGTYIAIAEVVGKAGKEIAKMKLDPVPFPPGESELNAEAEQYLGKVSDVLNNRPKLSIDICGKAVAEDRDMLMQKEKDNQPEKKKKESAKEPPDDEELRKLAETRGLRIKETLVNQHGIGQDRLYLCLPEILETPDQKPVAELLIN